ncbi:MAG: hypothetical protein AAF328_00095 [Planctomycetota bacterium]
MIIIALIAASRLIAVPNSRNGSATDGKIDNGQYYLKRGHVNYIAVSQDEFEHVKYRENWNRVALGGLLASIVTAGVIQKFRYPQQRL